MIRNFTIYCNIWRENNWLIKQNLCAGHIYIEEGQGSYMNHRPFSYKKLTILERIKFNWTNRLFHLLIILAKKELVIVIEMTPRHLLG